MVHFDERRSDFAPYGFTCEIWEALPMSRPDRHDEIEINYLDRGTLVYLLAGRRVVVKPKTWAMFWAAVPHQVVAFHNVTFYYVATIPFEQFFQWHVPKDLLARLVSGEVVTDLTQRQVLDDALMFRQWNRDLAKPSHAKCSIVQLEMTARILRLAKSTAISDRAGEPVIHHSSLESQSNLAKAESMALFVAQNYKSRIRISDIAKVVNLHPDYASTLFQQTFGTTLVTLITKHRVADAQRLLLTTDDRIDEIAQTAGFRSLSRFNSAFKATTGMTPREHRAQRRRTALSNPPRRERSMASIAGRPPK